MKPGVTLEGYLSAATHRLRSAGIEDARRDLALLVEAALRLDRLAQISDRNRLLGADEEAACEALVQRRLAGEPVSRILGKRAFWTLDLALSPAVLDPRPDSETLIEALPHYFPNPDQALEVLDLGTGSGCLLLAALKEFPAARGLGVDRSEAALQIAQTNARLNDLSRRCRFICANWGEALDHTWPLILCNPPYIRRDEIAELAPEVRAFDPPLALDGGPDGLDCYRLLANQLKTILSDGGFAFLEIGWDQAQAVSDIMTRQGLRLTERLKDLAGHDRGLVLAKP